MKNLEKRLRSYFHPFEGWDDGIAIDRGTIRSRPPTATLKRIWRHLRELNVTRLADLTPLDKIGLPTFTVCVPDPSFGESYSCGKGLTREAAMTSALMEAYEYRSCGSDGSRILRSKTYREVRKMGRAVDPNEISFPVIDRFSDGDRFDWAECIELNEATTVRAPADLFFISNPLRPGVVEANRFRSSNGMATGNSVCEAILHGLLELVERDSSVLANLKPQVGVAIDMRQWPLYLRKIVGRIEAEGIQLFVFDETSDIGLPCYEVYLAEQAGFDKWHIHSGHGCHIDGDVALSRALTEACQVRLVYFAGAREDVANGTSSTEAYARLQDTYLKAEKRRYASQRISGGSFLRMIEFVMERLRNAGLQRAYVSNNTLPGFDLCAVMCFVPGLEGYHYDERGGLFVGERALRIKAKFGEQRHFGY